MYFKTFLAACTGISTVIFVPLASAHNENCVSESGETLAGVIEYKCRSDEQNHYKFDVENVWGDADNPKLAKVKIRLPLGYRTFSIEHTSENRLSFRGKGQEAITYKVLERTENRAQESVKDLVFTMDSPTRMNQTGSDSDSSEHVLSIPSRWKGELEIDAEEANLIVQGFSDGQFKERDRDDVSSLPTAAEGLSGWIFVTHTSSSNDSVSPSNEKYLPWKFVTKGNGSIRLSQGSLNRGITARTEQGGIWVSSLKAVRLEAETSSGNVFINELTDFGATSEPSVSIKAGNHVFIMDLRLKGSSQVDLERGTIRFVASKSIFGDGTQKLTLNAKAGQAELQNCQGNVEFNLTGASSLSVDSHRDGELKGKHDAGKVVIQKIDPSVKSIQLNYLNPNSKLWSTIPGESQLTEISSSTEVKLSGGRGTFQNGVLSTSFSTDLVVLKNLPGQYILDGKVYSLDKSRSSKIMDAIKVGTVNTLTAVGGAVVTYAAIQKFAPETVSKPLQTFLNGCVKWLDGAR